MIPVSLYSWLILHVDKSSFVLNLSARITLYTETIKLSKCFPIAQIFVKTTKDFEECVKSLYDIHAYVMQFWSWSYYNEFKFNMSDQVKALNMGNTYDISLERSCLTIDVCCLLPRDDREGRTSRLWRSVDDVGHHSTCSNRTIEARGPRTPSLIWVTNRKWFFPFNWSADYR